MCNSPPVPVVAVAAVELTNSLIEVANGATALSSSTIVVIIVALVVAGVVVVVFFIGVIVRMCLVCERFDARKRIVVNVM